MILSIVFFLVALYVSSLLARALVALARDRRLASWGTAKQIGLRRVAVILLALSVGAISVRELVAFAGTGSAIPTAGRGFAYTPPTRPACGSGTSVRDYLWVDRGTPSRLLLCSSLTTSGAPAWHQVTVGTASIVN